MTYYFEFCGIKICCLLPFSITVTKESLPFISEQFLPDITIEMNPVQSLPKHNNDGFWIVNSYYLNKSDGYAVYFYAHRSGSPYAYVSWNKHCPQKLDCFYLAGHENLISYSQNIVDLLCLESLLLNFGSIILHSSFIRSNGRGILFTAPSGTGKSTQASLWEKYMGAEILNGDRAGIRKIGDTWHAFGLPYAGSSNIYRNESAPLKALVLLRQAKENRISRISSAEAMRSIYPEITIHRWDPDFVAKALDLFLELCTDVPVYLLECLPDEGAVRTLEERLLLEDHFPKFST